MGFNLADYEPVADRLARFWSDYPLGRVITFLEPAPPGEWVIRAEVYRNQDDPTPAASGLAHETVGATPINRTSALENCETSAVGRALANLNYAPKGQAARPSREEMAKVEARKEPEPPLDTARLHRTKTPKGESPEICDHGLMTFVASGTNKEGRPYGKSFTCQDGCARRWWHDKCETFHAGPKDGGICPAGGL